MSDAETSPRGLRDRQRAEGHLLIRRIAYDLALEHGVAAVSVQGISRAAGISPRTFFNHFRSKDEALVPDMPAFDPTAEQTFAAQSEPDLLMALDDLLGDYLTGAHLHDGVGEGPLAVKRLVEANPELVPRALAVFEAFEQHLATLVARRCGLLPEALFCRVTAATATATVKAAIGAWHEPTGNQCSTLRDLVHRAFIELRSALTAR